MDTHTQEMSLRRDADKPLVLATAHGPIEIRPNGRMALKFTLPMELNVTVGYEKRKKRCPWFKIGENGEILPTHNLFRAVVKEGVLKGLEPAKKLRVAAAQ